jgi:hypothetical protein
MKSRCLLPVLLFLSLVGAVLGAADSPVSIVLTYKARPGVPGSNSAPGWRPPGAD